MSLIGKVGYYVPKLYDYTKRLVYASPYILFEDAASKGAEAAVRVAKGSNTSLFQYIKDMAKAGGLGIEKSIKATQKATGGSFIKAMFKSIKDIPSVIKASTKWSAGRAIVAARAANKGRIVTHLAGIWGGTKGFFKGIGKKMPLIGNILMVAFELPNIVKATKEKGIGQGIAETVKAGVRLTTASIASAVGTAIGGPIGGIAGFIVGEWLAKKVIGKSYSEKVAEEQQKDQEAIERVQRMQQEGTLTQGVTQPQMVQQPAFTGNPFYNPYQSNPIDYDNFSNPYADDMFMKNMNFNAMC